MTTPALVVFDLGKVLLDFDYGVAAHGIASRSRVDGATVRRLIDHSELLFRFETGLMTRAEFFQAVQEATGFKGTLNDFAPLFTGIFQAIPPMVALAAELRRREIPTCILSNTNDLAIEHIRATFPFFSTFTDYILSYEQGVMKPETRIYKIVEQRAGVRGEQILFLDDRLENVEAARQLGWQTIHHTSPAPTQKRFRELGLTG